MLDGVPIAPPNVVKAPEEPTLTASAVATPVPSPDIPVDTGSPVAFVSVTVEGVPRLGVVSVGDVALTTLPVPVDVENDRFPEPSVASTALADPSADGKTKVTFAAKEAGALNSM
jgi:hypothetical protein